MRRATPSQYHRPSASAVLAAAGAGAVAFGLAWLMLASPPTAPQRPAVSVRQSAHRSLEAAEQAAAELLRPQSLATALEEAGIAGSEITPAAAADLAEETRESLRIDLREPDAAGVRTTVIRWMGDPAKAGASRLLHVLARRLAAPPSGDRQEQQRQYDAAQADLKECGQAVEIARQRLETALSAARRAAASADAAEGRGRETGPNVGRETRASGIAVQERADWLLAQQQLVDLEARRQSLADRLMPEHPEMKALDEKIEALQSSLSERGPLEAPPEPIAAEHRDAAPEAAAVDQERIAAAEARQAGQSLLAAQQRYEAALARERACWQTLFAAPRQAIAEIEPVPATVAAAGGIAWRRGVVAAMTALLCGGLTLAVWPARRLTFRTADEVRAVTRLPVVVVGRSSLN